jgi:V/A-type H+-transporting ATPase subunit D
MSKKIISGVRPTRIELLKLRRRELLAKKGHDLLEEKLDAMILELFRILEDYRKQRNTLGLLLQKAYETLTEARMVNGQQHLMSVSYAIPELPDISMGARTIMGVQIPVISTPETLRGMPERGYSYIGTSAVLDEAADAFEKVLKQSLLVAEKERTIQKIAQEIEGTRRRVNALENIFIPRLHATQDYIEMHLQELEREDFFRRKKTKKLLERV